MGSNKDTENNEWNEIFSLDVGNCSDIGSEGHDFSGDEERILHHDVPASNGKAIEKTREFPSANADEDDCAGHDWFGYQEKVLAERYGGNFIKVRLTNQDLLEYICELCTAPCNTKATLDQHCKGAKHIKKKAELDGTVPNHAANAFRKNRRTPPKRNYFSIKTGELQHIRETRQYQKWGSNRPTSPRRLYASPSPPRRRYASPSPPRRRYDSPSPPRRRYTNSSPLRSRYSTPSPPRHKFDDPSPPRRHFDPSSPSRMSDLRDRIPDHNLELVNARCMLEKLAKCSVRSEEDAKLALNVLSCLLKLLKDYNLRNGNRKNMELLIEIELKINTVKALRVVGILSAEKESSKPDLGPMVPSKPDLRPMVPSKPDLRPLVHSKPDLGPLVPFYSAHPKQPKYVSAPPVPKLYPPPSSYSTGPMPFPPPAPYSSKPMSYPPPSAY